MRLKKSLLKLFLFLFVTFVHSPAFCQTETLRIVNYNIEDKPTSGSESQDLRAIIAEIGTTQALGNAQAIDVFAFQEGPLSTSSYNFVENDFESVFGGDYESFYAAADSSGDRTGVVYNASRLTLMSAQSINNMNFTHPPTVATFRPQNGTAADEFTIISIHLKAGSSTSDLNRRENETNSIETIIGNLPAGAQVIVLGDFNMRGSDESAWGGFVDSGLVETLNAPFGIRVGNWNENLAFLPFHTQETSGAIGGMDDRFDVQLVSATTQDGFGFELIPGSLSVLANNGTHSLNGSLASGSGAVGIQAELISFSDHLPVFADYVFGSQSVLPHNLMSVEAIQNFTVTPSGPRTGNSGSSFMNIEGDSNGNFASFGVLDFDLSNQLNGDEAVSLVAEIGLELAQANAGFSENGPYSVYLASPAATAVTIDSTITYQSGNNGTDCLPNSLSAGAQRLATYPGVHRDANGSLLADGSIDSVALYTGTIADAIRDQLNQRGTVRLLLVPDLDETAATFAGRTNSLSLGPILFARYRTPTLATVTAFEVTQGVFSSGGLAELLASDNLDLVANRNPASFQALVQMEFESTSPVASPNGLTLTFEAAVFSRGSVTQSIDMWNHDQNSWEQVDSREATRFIDAVVTLDLSGDLSRFVDPQSGQIMSRCRFVSPSQRQLFSANVDRIDWLIE